MLASPDAERHAVTILRELPSEMLPVRIDADLMKQALLNVVLNGVQAMPNGGVLNLGIAITGDDRQAAIEVRDEGSGIPFAIRDKVYNLYFTTKKSGTGIGLAMTYKVMQLHHGSVSFESAEGRGTIFRLRLPLAEVNVDSARELAAQG